MSTTSSLAFLERDKFFAELEPQLVKFAIRYKAHDAAGESRSWYANFVKIFEQIQASSDHLVFQDFKTGGTISDPERIKANVISYMLASFRNALKKRDGFDRHRWEGTVEKAGVNTDDSLNELIDNTKITISDLIDVIAVDHKRTSRITTLRGKINHLFIGALLAYYQHLRATRGNIPIVKNLDAETARDFFVWDVVESRFQAVRGQLETAAANETRPEVLAGLSKLLDTVEGPAFDSPGKTFHATSGAAALRKKITHYFNEHHGGLRKRLLKRLAARGAA